MSSVPVDVSVVLPVYNEAGHLDAEIDRIRDHLDDTDLSYEIVVVDDGSTDGSTELLRQRDDIRLVVATRNRGSGAARRMGTELARGDVVVWTDVDMTYPNDRVAELVAALDGHDQVVGARTSEQGTVRLLRTPAKWLIRKLAVVLAQQDIPDLNSGFRAFRRSVAMQFLHLLPNGFSCVTTLTLAFLTNGYSVRYVDIPYAPRAGRSKFRFVKDSRRYVLQVVRMIMLHEPLRVLGPVGSVLLAAGVGKAAYDIITDPVVVAINTIVILLAALVTLLTGLLADVIAHLTREPTRVLPAEAVTASEHEVGSSRRG